MIKRVLVYIWNKAFDIYIKVKNCGYLFYDSLYKRFVNTMNK